MTDAKTYKILMELARLIHLDFFIDATVAPDVEGSRQKPGKVEFKSPSPSVLI